MEIDAKYLPLEGAYRWEREAPDRVYMVQPTGGGSMTTRRSPTAWLFISWGGHLRRSP